MKPLPLSAVTKRLIRIRSYWQIPFRKIRGKKERGGPLLKWDSAVDKLSLLK